MNDIEKKIYPPQTDKNIGKDHIDTLGQGRQFIINSLIEQLAYLNYYQLTTSVHQEATYCDIRICNGSSNFNFYEKDVPHFDRMTQIVDYQEQIIHYLKNFDVHPYVVEY